VRRGLSLALVVAAGVAAAVMHPTVARPAIDPAAIDALAESARHAWDVPGVAAVIVSPDRVLWLKGYGVRELGGDQPMTPDTVFPLASCTKAFTAVLIGMLADDGKLAWDAPVRKHWPDFHLADPLADAGVTLRDLLTHRTGLASHDFLWYRAPWPLEDIVHRAGRLPLERPFRTAFQYQSVMFAAAGLAAGRAAGDSWDALVRKRLFEPLGMASARCTTPTAAEAPDRATPHRPDRDGRLRVIPWYVQAEPNPAGSVHASARDLAAWLQFQLGDGSYRGRRLISAANLAETHTPQFALRVDGIIREANPETLQMSYGLGWVIQDYRGHLLVSHAGAIDGFRAHITLMPRDGYALALLANRHQTRMNLALSNALVDLVLGLPARDWNTHFLALVKREAEAKQAARRERDRERRQDSPPSRPLADYAGAYEHPAYGTATVRLADGRLNWEWSSFRGPLAHHHADTFQLDNEDLDDPVIEFLADGVTGVTRLVFLNLIFQKK
jgi:CubicO group peptidase (beta-lactamase class C family)